MTKNKKNTSGINALRREMIKVPRKEMIKKNDAGQIETWEQIDWNDGQYMDGIKISWGPSEWGPEEKKIVRLAILLLSVLLIVSIVGITKNGSSSFAVPGCDVCSFYSSCSA